MNSTLIIQSHRSPLPYQWLSQCLGSVSEWCKLNHFDYRFVGDKLFDLVDPSIIEKTRTQVVILSDIARLIAIKQALDEKYTRVIWLDADFLIFDPDRFVLPKVSYAFGREVWVQPDKQKRLKVYNKIHNAFLMFSKDNSFLDFYIESAIGLLEKNTGAIPPQFIGPKFLSAIHNIACLPVMETAGMLSPAVIKDIILGDGNALDLFKKKSPQIISGANLCCSSVDKLEVNAQEMDALISRLLNSRRVFQ